MTLQAKINKISDKDQRWYRLLTSSSLHLTIYHSCIPLSHARHANIKPKHRTNVNFYSALFHQICSFGFKPLFLTWNPINNLPLSISYIIIIQTDFNIMYNEWCAISDQPISVTNNTKFIQCEVL